MWQKFKPVTNSLVYLIGWLVNTQTTVMADAHLQAESAEMKAEVLRLKGKHNRSYAGSSQGPIPRLPSTKVGRVQNHRFL